MAITKDFEAFVIELLSGLGEVRTKRMFGGASVYAGEVLFALADDDALWIKADEQSTAAFEAAGSPLFSYPMKDGSTATMPYRRLPDSAMDDPDEAVRWARLGIEAALRKKAAPKKKASKRDKL